MPLNMLERTLKFAGKGAKHCGTGLSILIAQSFFPAVRPLAQFASIAWLPLAKRHRDAGRCSQATSMVAKQTVLLTVIEKLLSVWGPDIHRTCRFWSLFLPIHTRYLFTKLRFSEKRGYTWKEVEEAWDKRHTWGAPRICALLQTMSGYYVKSAQVLASKGDFLPRQWTEELTPIFFDNMRPHAWAQIQSNLRRFLRDSEWAEATDSAARDGLIEDIVANCQHSCIASASIAQVHAGRLSQAVCDVLNEDASQSVVFKIQHTDMQRLMDSDIRNLRRLCQFIKNMLPYDPTPMLNEMAETVGKEFDFRREARLMDAVRSRLQPCKLAVQIPRPIHSLTTTSMLVMQRMQGTAMSSILQERDAGVMARAGKCLETLMHAYGVMIFQYGLFHADPHAGNLLLSDDDTLVLLDFGQCKALPPERHLGFAKLVVAMDDGNTWGIVQALSNFKMDFKALGGGIPDPKLIQTFALIAFDTRPLPEALINPLAEDAVIKQIPLREAPEDLFSLGRTIMLLRGLCHSLGVNIQAAKLWRPYAERAIKEHASFQHIAEVNSRLDLGQA